MLALHLSKDFGETYKVIEHFDNLIIANKYVEEHETRLEKSRWFIDDEKGHILVVCSMFETVAKNIDSIGISEDSNLLRYLLQQRFVKCIGISS